MAKATLVLRRQDVAQLLTLDACIEAVEEAFRQLGSGQVQQPTVLGMHAGRGGFHVKAALFNRGSKQYFAVKCNANFSDNMRSFGLPAIQGLIILCDAQSGYPLAIMDSIEITILRTGAATAIAAKHLARPDSRVATICGCGNQGRVQLRALTRVLPIERVFAIDIDPATASTFASELTQELGISVEPFSNLGIALGASDVCVTCTPSSRPYVRVEYVRPGTFIAAVGADSSEKQELDPMLLRVGTIVVDVLEQCSVMGELHHAIEAKLVESKDVHAVLGEIVTGVRPGRMTQDAITIFDSTGTAIQDAAAAVAVFSSINDRSKFAHIDFNT
jgi:ornithine cyclodeaminase/alanine dehydrogenase